MRMPKISFRNLMMAATILVNTLKLGPSLNMMHRYS